MKVVPGGKISYFSDLRGRSDFIGRLTPSDRVAGGDTIIGDPAYFSLSVPRRFEKARLTLEFQNDTDRPLIEVGVLTDKRVWNYDLKPLQNKVLDGLFNEWSVLWDADVLLFQRNKEYESVKDFLAKRPPMDRVAVYDYDLGADFTLADYRPATTSRTMCRPLEGAYQFYTYIKDEDLDFDFFFRDLNKNSDPDPIDIFVYYGDQEIAAESLGDDEGGSEDRHLRLFLAGLPEGVYKVGVRVNSDIVTRSISTKQAKLAFINKVALADAPEVSCGRNLYTGSRRAQFKTVLADRLGEIRIHQVYGNAFSEIVDLYETYRQFETKQDLPSFSEIVMPSDGIVVSGDGLFSFSAKEYFDPRPRKAVEGFDPDRDGIDFVITRYVPPVKDGDTLVSSVDFDLTGAYKEKGKHSFLISVPGLRVEEGTGQGVVIKSIKVDLEGVSLWEKIGKMIKDK
jgi:hypothetical protein